MNFFKIQFLIGFTFILSSSNLCGQDAKLGAWYMYFGQLKLKEKFNIHHEVQYRSYNLISDFHQLLLRGGIGMNLTENNNNILLGYTYVFSEKYVFDGEKESIHENMIYQQFITKQDFGRIKIQHRYRFEERFFTDDFKFRFRYFLRFDISLNNKDLIDKTIYLSMFNELFIHSGISNYDRDRLCFALGYKINNKVKIEFGYMNEFLQNLNNIDQLMTSIFATF